MRLAMNIRLKPDTEEWLKSQVTEGRFESIEEAVELLIAEDRLTRRALDSADLSWAQPCIDEGLAAVEAGDVIPAEDVHKALLKHPKQR
jgi:predicted transcriptional regulator